MIILIFDNHVRENNKKICVCLPSKLTPVFIVSQLQVEMDSLMQLLVFTKAASEDLHSNVKAIKNVRCKAGSGKNQAEEQKLKQVDGRKLCTLNTSHFSLFWLHLAWSLIKSLLLIQSTPISSGSVHRAADKGHGEADAADNYVWGPGRGSSRGDTGSQRGPLWGNYDIE